MTEQQSGKSERHRRHPTDDWTPDEDRFLRSETVELEHRGWKNITKRFNRVFPGREKSCYECRKRALRLLQEDEAHKPWTSAEDFVVTFGYHAARGHWQSVYKCLKRRDKESIRLHFYAGIEDLAKRIHDPKERTEPAEKLNAYLCARLFLSTLSDPAGSDPEVVRILNENGTRADDCLALARTADPARQWTPAALEIYVENVVEELQNRLHELRAIIQQQKSINQPSQPMTKLPIRYTPLPIELITSLRYGYYFNNAAPHS